MSVAWINLWPMSGGGYDLLEVVVEVLLIGLAVHWLASILHGTRGLRPLRALLILLVVVTLVVRVLAARLDWTRLELLYRYFVVGLGFIALVAFQPELRRAVFRVGEMRLARRKAPQSKLVHALVKAAAVLSREKHGALVAIERAVNLQGWADNGTTLNADVSANLLTSIFFPNSTLHDLGVIIRGNRVLAANCQFPIAEGDEVDPTLGSRHLAAAALSYETDALVLVVSEETGAIALADDGELARFLSLDELENELDRRLSGNSDGASVRPLYNLWRQARHVLLVATLTATLWYLADQASQIESVGTRVELRVDAASGNRMVDVLSPQPPTFSVTLRGTTRAVNALRSANLGEPLRAVWSYADDSDPGTRTLVAAEVLDRLNELRGRGVRVVAARPERLVLEVHEQKAVQLPVRLVAGEVAVEDVVLDPAIVSVRMRSTDLNQISRDDLFVAAPLNGRLGEARPDQQVTLTLPLSDRVGGRPAAVSPGEVRVSFRVVAQREQKRIPGVNVLLVMPPRFVEDYRVERRDPNEFLIEVVVEGDRSEMSALSAANVRAYAELGPEIEPPTADYRTVEIRFDLPRGVALVGPPRTVQVRLVPRQASSP